MTKILYKGFTCYVNSSKDANTRDVFTASGCPEIELYSFLEYTLEDAKTYFVWHVDRYIQKQIDSLTTQLQNITNELSNLDNLDSAIHLLDN